MQINNSGINLKKKTKLTRGKHDRIGQYGLRLFSKQISQLVTPLANFLTMLYIIKLSISQSLLPSPI